MAATRTLRAVLLAIAFMGDSATAQSSQVAVPPDEALGLLHFVFAWGRESPLGSLRDVVLPDSAIELRVWSGFGLTGTRGLVLQRSANGQWAAKRVVVQRCLLTTREREPISEQRFEQLRHEAKRKCSQEPQDGLTIPADTLALYPLSLPTRPDSVWLQILEAGLENMPTHNRRIDGTSVLVTLDGYHHVLEYRQGLTYRASVASGPIERVVMVLRSVFAWER